ncbi:hypothetical protein BGW36DRAFT_463828 [Talaromyces proteolyticus]|uniref:Zn(2)-C6 fungal-type domain-containing protein n=1 Tax=Talaromyces proteolyticus TaxID=1131652 RepID=A0AAD4KLU6_9EURO|nr:uncharacterized protein BGW36DRAFT_463828 [Talaromyces proteolyticus]KAH8694273.1 hypothetical protein BGW36DRAFT_463828 [Talaromyces proteolyticus]
MESVQPDHHQLRAPKQAACTVCHGKKLKCKRAPGQARCERCAQHGTECIVPNHPVGRQKGVKNKRKGVDKALHQIEQAIKKSKIHRSEEAGNEVSKVIVNLQHLLDKAQQQALGRMSSHESASNSRLDDETRSESTDSSEVQTNANNTLTTSTEDSLALDDAENPLQLLARASDLQLLPSSTQNASSLPLQLAGGVAANINLSSRVSDSFFVPVKASPDVSPDLDPVNLGLVTFDEASMLFNFFYDNLSHTRWGFDPAIHTAVFVRAQSAFLFTSILSASALFISSTAALSKRLSSHVKKLAQNVIAHRHRSVEIVLAFMANVPWMDPGKQLGDDDTCLYIAMALNIALDLSLNKVTTLSQTADGRKFARADCLEARRALLMDGFGDVDPQSEWGRRLLRRRERTWIALFVVERGVCLARGRSYSVPVTALLENCDRWHLVDRDIADPRDGQMNSMAVLRRDLDELFRKVRHACDDYRDKKTGMEVARLIQSMIENFYDGWYAIWAKSIGGEFRSLPPYVEILVTHTRLSTYSGVINHPTAPFEVKRFFRSEALSSSLNVMRAAIQGESRLKSMPNNTVIMIAFAACSALSLSLTGAPSRKNRNSNRLAPSVLNLIKETADVLERIGATPSHRNGASVLYGKLMRDLVGRVYNYTADDRSLDPESLHTITPSYTSREKSSNNYAAPESISSPPMPYVPYQGHYSTSLESAGIVASMAETLQFSTMSNDQIVDAVNSVGLSLDDTISDHRGFPLNEMMPWEWFDYLDTTYIN